MNKIYIKEINSRGGYVGYIGKKVCFVNYKFPSRFTGIGYFSYNEDDLMDKGNYYILNNIILPHPEIINGIEVYENTCSCRLCRGYDMQDGTCKAGARNPRTFYFDKDKHIIIGLTSKGWAEEFSDPNSEHSYVEVYNYGEKQTYKGKIVYMGSDSDHGCEKIIEHQEIVIIRII